ncbi:MAG: DUF1097 domain-containing protein [Actinobacteria bacterium]|nr:DUF1097 domain-containing protein [Actinomycetota bacterium]
MSQRVVSTVVVGLLAAVSVVFTAYVVIVPIWVVFIAWACFFAAGGGGQGARSTLVMGAAGIISATLTLIAGAALGGSVWAVAACCIVGAGALVAIGHFPLLSFTPAGFLGFASTAGTIAATQSSITDPVAFTHPSVLVGVAFVVGVAFGLTSEYLPAKLTPARSISA